MTKAHIIEEILRTAAANGGTPLGTQRFQAKTGIRESDWLRFWPRWRDAVREAGLQPNNFGPLWEKSTLLDLYATLTRELRRLPTWRDLVFKRYNDANFPGPIVLRSRLGPKEQLVRRLGEHCRSRGGLDDVVQLCEAYVPPKNKPSDADAAASADDSTIGFVYLLKSGRFYKVGRSNSAGRREYELGLQLPEPVRTVHTVRTDDPVGIEEYWHKRFHTKRVNGEWFQLDPRDVAAFKRRKFM
jgi:hypothetical protein